MPDKRGHRGPHPKDRELFDAAQWPTLRAAAGELYWLLDRGYPPAAALKLVGDRHRLVERQRTAVARCACTADEARRRIEHQWPIERLSEEPLWLDGYNVLTSIEAALAGGVILLARDGCFRDMASMHGSYRKVAETLPALELLGDVLAVWHVGLCHWWLDRPVSNSGRLRQIILDVAATHGWQWEVSVVPDPDPVLAEAGELVASCDSQVLDRCGRWVNLARLAIEERVPDALVVDLSCERLAGL